MNATERAVLLDEGWTDHLTTVLPHAVVDRPDCRHVPNISDPIEPATFLNDELVDSHLLLAGSPDTVAAQVADAVTAAEVNYIAGSFAWGR